MEQQESLRDEMHDRFDALHLEVIRQMELGIKAIVGRMEQMSSENAELKQRVAQLEAENLDLRKRTY